MIRFIRGTLVSVTESEAVLENNGIGLAVHIPSSVAENLPALGIEVLLYTYMNVKEDAIKLFGFLSQDDLQVFKLLITVNGVGPKAALGILSALSSDDIRYAVSAGDAKTIAKAPGIGPKTASKVILELRDKLTMDSYFSADGQDVSGGTEQEAGLMQNIQDAIEALVVLGYPRTEAAKAVHAVPATKDTAVDELLKQSLKNI